MEDKGFELVCIWDVDVALPWFKIVECAHPTDSIIGSHAINRLDDIASSWSESLQRFTDGCVVAYREAYPVDARHKGDGVVFRIEDVAAQFDPTCSLYVFEGSKVLKLPSQPKPST